MTTETAPSNDSPPASSRPRLTVVVPAYQEGSTIAHALERMREVFDTLDRTYEVLLVSDGNTDGTETAAKSVDFPQLEVFHYAPNRGKGYALRFGFERARADIVAFIDGDLDIHPSCVLALLAQLEATDADAVIGSKVHPDSEVVYPMFRRFQSRVFRTFIRSLFRLDVTDTQTGCKVFRRQVLDTCLPHVQSDGFAFDLELLVLANDAGYRVTEGPIALDYQFSSSTGIHAVGHVLREVFSLARRRSASRRAGTWLAPITQQPIS